VSRTRSSNRASRVECAAVVEQNTEIDVALAVRPPFAMAAEEVDGHESGNGLITQEAL